MEFLSVFPGALIGALVVAFLATVLALLTTASWDRCFCWLGRGLGTCALVGGIGWFLLTPDPTVRVWVYSLGQVSLAEGTVFTAPFKAADDGRYFVALAHDAVDVAPAASPATDTGSDRGKTAWEQIEAPWTIHSPNGAEAFSAGLARKARATPEGLLSLGKFEALAGEPCVFRLRVAHADAALKDASARVEVRPDYFVQKGAHLWAGLRRGLLWSMVGAGLFLFLLAAIARSGPQNGRRARSQAAAE